MSEQTSVETKSGPQPFTRIDLPADPHEPPTEAIRTMYGGVHSARETTNVGTHYDVARSFAEGKLGRGLTPDEIKRIIAGESGPDIVLAAGGSIDKQSIVASPNTRVEDFTKTMMLPIVYPTGKATLTERVRLRPKFEGPPIQLSRNRTSPPGKHRAHNL